tara:strand:+ start:2541 stop:3986 length:1446 start_codon:yes stop_codon:yes gene_type:complete
MFNISLELGVSSLVLISTILCIWFVLKKITTITMHHDLAINSDAFSDSKINDSDNSDTINTEISGSKNFIPGLDKSIFEKFKKNLNLKSNTSDKNSSSENLHIEDFIETLNNNEIDNSKTVFAEELSEKEQVKVTLSKNAKNLNEHQETNLKEDNDLYPNLNNIPKTKKNSSNEKLGAGEEELKILSSKQKALREQTENSENIDLNESDEDLFEDELIPTPGGKKFSQIEKKDSKYKKDSQYKGSYLLEDGDFIENSINRNQTEEEKKSEAESLLKLATSSCEAGKMEEAKVSLKVYLDLLKDLDQEPSGDVKKLSEKLNVPFNLSEDESTNVIENLEKLNFNKEPILQDLPEQTNYANVMDGLVKSLEEKEAYEDALPLLKDLIEYNRKRGNLSEMDNLYDRIEQAYSSLKNDENLVSAYEEHLKIKKQLDDLEGEQNLLDLISYYYANTGDQEASIRYQDESKRVKNIIEEKINSEKNS